MQVLMQFKYDLESHKWYSAQRRALYTQNSEGNFSAFIYKSVS